MLPCQWTQLMKMFKINMAVLHTLVSAADTGSILWAGQISQIKWENLFLFSNLTTALQLCTAAADWCLFHEKKRPDNLHHHNFRDTHAKILFYCQHWMSPSQQHQGAADSQCRLHKIRITNGADVDGKWIIGGATAQLDLELIHDLWIPFFCTHWTAITYNLHYYNLQPVHISAFITFVLFFCSLYNRYQLLLILNDN